LIIDGDENEEIEIYRAEDLGDPLKPATINPITR
jgi:hypothetical protein